MQPEVIFFYGPPCAAKALFYTHHFSLTHERISPHELFEADPSLSLRAVILKVVNFVNKGQNVVVDDEKSSKKTRKSYLNIIGNKAPFCSYRAVNFNVSPYDGLLLCQWAREWELAYQFESVCLNTPLKETAKDVECWFERTNEPPGEEEGFNQIKKVEVQLICDTSFKFVVPALFIQWEEDVQCNVQKMSVDVIKRWSHCNPYGRVIVLRLSEKKSCNDGNCEYMEEMKQVISKLAVQAEIPVFFVHLCGFRWAFHRPPNPGLFAWLQRLHSIDLSNKATFYLYSSESHQKAASAAGVKCIKASKLLHNPQMINAVHCGLTAQVPDCVRKAKLAWFGSQSRPAASVPLFQRAVTSHDATANGMPPHCVAVTSNLRVHGVCFKDLEALRSFNFRYQQNAVPTEPASNDLFNDQDCQTSKQNSNTRERKRNIPSGLSSDESEATKVSRDKHSVNSTMDQPTIVGPFSPSQIATHLTRKDIERLAFSAGHFKRGEGCVRLVRDVLTSVEQDGVLFTAKCLGSQGQLYNVSTLLCLKGILQAHCSCADPASKLGKCKHAIALLLWCTNEENIKNVDKPSCPPGAERDIEHVTPPVTKPKDGICEVPVNSKQVEVPSHDRKSKSLPKWIVSFTQSTSSDADSSKRTGDEFTSGKLLQKRMKTRKVVDKTLYCLSPKELLQTAEEVLEEHRCSLPDCEGNAPEQSKQHLRKDNPECRTKSNAASTKQLSQGSSSREIHASPTESGVLIRETLFDGRQSGNPSNDSNTISVVPESVAGETKESQSKDNRLNLNEPALRSVANPDNNKRTQPDLTGKNESEKKVTASILDDFV